MINITDFVLEIDTPTRWPAARRWLTEHYGTKASIPIDADYTDKVLEPGPQKYENRWALITFSIKQEDGARHSYFYLDFQNPDDELVFRLKWL